MLPLETFKLVVKSTPLVSIDLIVRNSEGKILLGKRANRPAKGNWFVPGGRVLKDESLEDAFNRLIIAELGLIKTTSSFKGVYQHFYDDNFCEEIFTTHYVVLAYEIEFNGELSSLPIEQHTEYKWFNEKELLASDTVHMHTKWYFQADKQADKTFK
ncbi:GDP-mannose mannosyl hydrolase [Shewanella fidelis]|uniref:GDP-mannose mannosyl hydrolase n=1 Tax=Shewanella fidelis TaxID=173509 RepID=A0AAW8NRS4_9GAMM|nr:GDP-mannose mannosyl hydrolase [Shewanella fidelis]MDR8524433.1 GDP-mannose mannosyl hydrolase [Shewanella fidelis]MDW4811909.1 GDP-mannose mannosyl hydrolase [Shewanella fidelis]MDW4817152.1 GDP-mannose mannosyl hydrolase [Shewanella fidelis]MDW4821222.1 GDP-mannose mannosyl hydrolase [Shewanella fidelis]MDW4822515.1 GDP-mannose mannosyl hydrolase [Shewanella fidelis]